MQEDLELIYRRIGRLLDQNPDLVRIVNNIQESKHLATMPATRWHNDPFSRKMHMAIQKSGGPGKTTFAALALVSILGLVSIFNKRLLELLYRVEFYSRKMKAPDLKPIQKADFQSRNNGIVDEIRKLFKDSYLKAYASGVRSHGFEKQGTQKNLSDKERKWVESAVRHEIRYLNGLLDDVKSGKAVVSMLGRIRMYGNALQAAYVAGEVVASPPGTVIHWDIDPLARHCQDCLTLQRYGPYTKNTLPTTPRAGCTSCRSNCRCTLRYEIAEPEAFEQVEKENRTKDYVLYMIRRRAGKR